VIMVKERSFFRIIMKNNNGSVLVRSESGPSVLKEAPQRQTEPDSVRQSQAESVRFLPPINHAAKDALSIQYCWHSSYIYGQTILSKKGPSGANFHSAVPHCLALSYPEGKTPLSSPSSFQGSEEDTALMRNLLYTLLCPRWCLYCTASEDA
jgi:hypothetical protein